MTDVEKLRKDARKIFDLCSEGRATIGPEIFPKMLRGLGMDPTKATIKAMWEEMDTDKSGEVDFEEFCVFMKDRHHVKSRSEAERELREVFAALDQNGDGRVTLEAKIFLTRS